jgi:hypothetical protein
VSKLESAVSFLRTLDACNACFLDKQFQPITYGIMPSQNWVGTLDDGCIFIQAVCCWHFDVDIIKILENPDDYPLPVPHPRDQWHGCQTKEGL